MDGACGGRKRTLRVERSFEATRLEQQLWAMAYESAVPIVQRLSNGATRQEPQRPATGSGQATRKRKGA
jgi:hypothetical protein